ncbi:MAG: cobalt transporter CbiM [bacterium]
MHISEGVLSAPVLIAGAISAVACVAYGLKKIEYDRIPEAAILSSAFFVVSLIHVPIGPSSVHLILNGLMGLLLGWMAFPAILVALIFQAILFQFGGITSLGVNTLIMGLPAVIVFYLCNNQIRKDNVAIGSIFSFLAGALGVFLAALLMATSLVFTGESFIQIAKLAIIAHLPVMVIEGIITAVSINFLKKVKPEILEVAYVTKYSCYKD